MWKIMEMQRNKFLFLLDIIEAFKCLHLASDLNKHEVKWLFFCYFKTKIWMKSELLYLGSIVWSIILKSSALTQTFCQMLLKGDKDVNHKITVTELARKNERSVTQGVTMWVNSLPLGYIFCRDLHQPVSLSLSLPLVLCVHQCWR